MALEKLVRGLDKGELKDKVRQLGGIWRWIAFIFAVGLVGFHLYTGAFGLLPDMEQRSVHVMLALSLTFILLPGINTGKVETKPPIWDILAVSGIILLCVNYFINYEWYINNIGESSAFDIFLGLLALVLVLEGARRSIGWFFPLFVGVLMFYALFGSYFPGFFNYPGIRPFYLIQSVYQSPSGMWGEVTGMSATIVAMFIIFGAFVLFTGGGDAFFKISTKIAGRLPGGPALVSVLASALFGTISGSTVANVVTTGTFTIPTMKRAGFSSAFAGAVEAAASTGGQLMPPIMGAGAFIMAEILGIPYTSVCIAAFFPAVLYFSGIFICILLMSLKTGMKPLPKELIPPTREVFNWGMLAPFVIPVVVLLYQVFIGRSLVHSGFWACVTAGIIFLLKDLSLGNMKNRFIKMLYGLETGGRALVSIVSLLVAATIAVQLLSMTGLAVKISGLIVGLGKDNLAIAYILAMIMSLILGMGLPTVAAYVVAAAVGVPSLVELGVLPLAAHLFVFYFACCGSKTPPVCAAVYAAAPIAQAPWLKIAWIAMRLGIVAYLIPYSFIMRPGIMMEGSLVEIISALLACAVAVIIIAIAEIGYYQFSKKVKGFLYIPARILIFFAGALILLPFGTNGVITSVALILLSIPVQKLSSWFHRTRLA